MASLLQWPESFKIINWKVLALLILTYLSVGLPEFDLFFVTSPIFLLIASYPCPLAAPLFCSPCCMGSYNRQFTENIVIRSHRNARSECPVLFSLLIDATVSFLNIIFFSNIQT